MDNSIVGSRIAEGRRAKGLSQAQLAGLVRVSPQAVGKWERGESLPDIFMLGKIAGIIEKPNIDYFLGKRLCDCEVCGCCNGDNGCR